MPKSKWNRLRFAVYDRNPNLFGAFQLSLNELHAIVYTFSEKRKHDLTRHALQVIEKLLQRYLSLRHGSLRVPTSTFALFQPSQMTFDPLLTQQLEQLNAHGRRAQASGEQELTKQVISTLNNLALFSLEIDTAFEAYNENPISSFVSAYHWGLLKEAALKRQDDVALEGTDQLQNLGQALLQRMLVLNVTTTIENLESVALISLISGSDVVLGNTVQAMSSLVFSNAVTHHPSDIVNRRLFDALERTVLAKLKQGVGLDYPQLNFSLGPFLSPTESTSLAQTVVSLANGIAEALRRKDWNRAKSLISGYAEINDHLWKHLADIGTDAAKRETFLLHFLSTSIQQILRVHFWLREFLQSFSISTEDEQSTRLKYRIDDFQEELEKYISWQTVGIFSRVLPATLENKRKFLDDILETLFEASLMATEATIEGAVSIQDQIARTCEKLIDKRFTYEAPRKGAYLAKIGTFAMSNGNPEVELASLKSYTKLIRLWLDTFPEQPSFTGSFAEAEDNLLRELREPRLLLHEPERRWVESVTEVHIKAFFKKVYADLAGETG